MIVRELIALLGFETDKKSAATVDKEVGEFVKRFKALAVVAGAAATAAVLKGIAESVGQMGDEISTAAARLGIGVQALQELRFAADRADVSQEELGVGLRTVSKNAFEAANGNKEAAETFQRLGVRVTDASGKLKPAEQLLQESADGFARLSSDTERTALAMKAFGKSGGALIPLFAQGSKGIEEMRARAHALGGVLDDELIELANDWDDSLKDVDATIQGLRNAVGKALLPVLTRINKAWTEMMLRHGDIIRSGIERTLSAIGRIVGSTVEFFIAAADATMTWLENLSPLQKGILAATAALAGLLLLLALPGGVILILAGLIGLIIDDFMAWRAGGQSVIGDLIGSLDDLKAEFPGLFEFLAGVQSGFEHAFNIATNTIGAFIQFFIGVWTDPLAASQEFMLQLQAIFDEFIVWLGEVFGTEFASIFGGIFEVLAMNFKIGVETLTNILYSIVQFVMDVFTTDLSTAFSNLWENLKVAAQQWVDSVLGFIRKITDVGGRIGAALGFGGAAGAAAPTAAAAPAALGRPPSSVSNQQTNKIDVAVNAQGASNPDEIGVAVARQVEIVLERQNRDAMGALTVSTASP